MLFWAWEEIVCTYCLALGNARDQECMRQPQQHGDGWAVGVIWVAIATATKPAIAKMSADLEELRAQ